MTSHYLRCTVNGSFEKVFEELGAEFGDIYARRFGKAGEPKAGVILGNTIFSELRTTRLC